MVTVLVEGEGEEFLMVLVLLLDERRRDLDDGGEQEMDRDRGLT